MEKNWLIRTKSNHILGPVSKDKVIELYHNGSIRPEDEICSGNGFWFFLREKDQVELYLLGNRKQSFNPLSEARDVLTAAPLAQEVYEEPAEDYDITLVSGINVTGLSDKTDPGSTMLADAIREAKENSAPKKITLPEDLKDTTPPTSPGRPKRKEVVQPLKKLPPKPLALQKRRHVSDRMVMGLAITLLVILATLLYFRKRLLGGLIEGTSSVVGISKVYAQESESPVKKKVFLR